ncbi:ImmA/IrrE family metallo-endopeptidase [Paenibacillus elgii]|uniref:ImmA/IrrE family metallo-endopeptidase n=1 Tax=Paenibacillus elgii TaxID=189691 RepID=UPI00203C5F7A|nr:ImmA/IrrE family metallo-endopeptidase [Paenibacillus elgii]MCM3273691.1 ImmA/IrrE family metallo-endopeptidase [Paenibacillus elgii]
MDRSIKAVQDLMKKHRTNNPFEIAAERNIIILFEELGKNIWGYFSCSNRIPIIHVNNRHNGFEQLFTIAHEIGHYVLHPKVNTPFLRKKTLFSVDRIEREANRFAVHLLIGEEKIEYGESLSVFLLRCGIPEEMHEFY